MRGTEEEWDAPGSQRSRHGPNTLIVIEADIKQRGYKLDVTWLRDEALEDSDDLPEPQDLANEAITELEAAAGDLREIIGQLEKEEAIAK